jgi:hypothetical protein
MARRYTRYSLPNYFVMTSYRWNSGKRINVTVSNVSKVSVFNYNVHSFILCITNSRSYSHFQWYTCTETCQKYPVTVIFYYIFHIKPQFFKALFQSQFLFDFDESLTNRSENVRSFLWLFWKILNIHDLNTNLNYLSSNVLSSIIVLYFWRSKFSFVLK